MLFGIGIDFHFSDILTAESVPNPEIKARVKVFEATPELRNDDRPL
jgi:hypothetical protein